jgi:hypothetical protein
MRAGGIGRLACLGSLLWLWWGAVSWRRLLGSKRCRRQLTQELTHIDCLLPSWAREYLETNLRVHAARTHRIDWWLFSPTY